MSARILAAFCLLNLVVVSGRGYSSEVPSHALVVYLAADPGQSQRPLDYMKLEVGRLMHAAGFRVEWRDARASGRESTESQLAFVELRGACSISAGSAVSGSNSSSFASTSISGGEVLPFSWVDCSKLTQALSASLAAEPGARRDFLYGRAVARVVAHELYHILLKTGDHSREGVARPSFTVRDMLAEHFEFEQSVLARLQHGQESAWHTGADEASGR